MNRFYVYALLDTSKPGHYDYDGIIFEFEPFYIGKGTNNRIKDTLLARYNNRFKENKILSLQRKHYKVISIKIFEELEEQDSFSKEILLIKRIGRRDLGLGPLTNLTDGGDGRINIIVSEETRQKLREINTKNAEIRKLNGLDKHTPEMVQHLRIINTGERNPMFGRLRTEESKEEHSKRVSGQNHPMFGKKHSQETILKIKKNRESNIDIEKQKKTSIEFNSKKVVQYSLDGEYIQEFDSIKIASKETGLSQSLIGKTCRGVVKNPRKFIFKFKDAKDLVYRNSYIIGVGDEFEYNGEKYTLIKRNHKSIIASDGDIQITIRSKDFPMVFHKKYIVYE